MRTDIRNLKLHHRMVLLVCLGLGLVACSAPPQRKASPQKGIPYLASASFNSPDGRVIPVRTFLPQQEGLKAVVLALHGFNDYSRAFATVGPYFANHGIGLIAYDQRGFGMSEGTGLWAGSSAYIADLEWMVRAIKDRYRDIPIFILGESMGAAVVITGLAKVPGMKVDGVILSAPALWSRDTMPWYQSLVLDVAATTFPEARLTGSGLRVQASDNIEMLRGLGRDPWVIKATRIDAIQGLTDLMDRAQIEIDQIKVPTLILYGGKDEIIPADPVKQAWYRVSEKSGVRAAFYPQGFHLLLRDLNATLPLKDVLDWMNNPNAPLSSGCEVKRPKDASGAFQVGEACLSGHAVSRRQGGDPG